jgi:hypothetical protein
MKLKKLIGPVLLNLGVFMVGFGVLAVIIKEIYLLQEVIREIGLIMIPVGLFIGVIGAVLSNASWKEK